MCEKDVYQLAPAEAALILRDAKYGYRCDHEWVDYKFDGDASRVVRQAVKNRHQHSREEYKVARALIELALEGAL